MIHLEFRGGGSRKFWEISVDGRTHTVRFGKIGTAGRSQTKTFKTPELAKKDADALTKTKLKKGYTAKAGGAARAPQTSQKAAKPVAKSTPKRGGRDLAAIVEALFAARSAAFPEDPRPKLRKPATKEQIAALEKAWKRPLPPSYRAFLEVTNGLAGEAFTHRIIGTEDQKWAARQIKDMAEFWDDFDASSIFPVAVPHADDGIHDMAVFDATKKGDELPVVDWDHGREHQRFPSFAAYLEDEIKVLSQVAEERAVEDAAKETETKAVSAARASLDARKAIPKSGPGRAAAFRAVFELTKPSEIETAIELLLDAKPSPNELITYFEGVEKELGARQPAGYARAELAFHRALVLPKTARFAWLKLGGAALAHVGTEDPKRAARWADVLCPAVREEPSLGHRLAVAYASAGRIDDALAMVQAAIQTEYAQVKDMRTDAALRPLFKDPRFQKLFGPADDTKMVARTRVPRDPALEAQVAAGKSIAAYAAWLTKQGSALGEVVAADSAADRSPAKKKSARAAFAAYKKAVLDPAFPLISPHFTTHLDPGYYFSFHYGFLEKLDTFSLRNAKERAEALALLADPHGMFVKHVTLRGAKLDSLEVFARLPALRRIQNAWTDITQVDSTEPIAKLTHLRALDLARSKVKDLRPLAKLPLIQLYLGSTEVVDLSPLAKHPTLSHITLSNTKVRDLSPLLTCPKLCCVGLFGVKTVDKVQVEKLRAYVKAAKNRPSLDDALLAGYDREVIYFD